MEIYYLVLSFVLFSTTACFSVPDVLSEYGNANISSNTIAKGCNCDNGRCVIDKQGNTKCACKPGYSLQDAFTCRPCDCGTLGKCIFILKLSDKTNMYQYQKKCVCNTGCAEKEGVCVDCFCGENSACDYDYGERRCYCLEGFAELNKVCTKCDCGFYGKCEFKNGEKKCFCEDGYLEIDGICEECDCGDHGTCSIKNGMQNCKCEPGYSVKDGKCEACECGPNAKQCLFVNGLKQCDCKARYADRYGTCEECYCGTNTKSCNFRDNKMTCNCVDEYVQKGDSCELGCSAKHPCQNGGFCKGGLCYCLKGTRGAFCEEIDECSTLCPKQSDISCGYDVGSQRAYCKCQKGDLRYNPNMKQCRNPCDERKRCENGGECATTGRDLFCKCPPGTSGDFCEKIPECDTKQCSADSKCVYDTYQKTAVCMCNDFDLKFDPKTLQCKYTCDPNRRCRNGGSCLPRGTDSFCDCLPGTKGDLCEKIPECDTKNCGRNAECSYDSNRQKAVCLCRDKSLSFDPTDGRCKKTCNTLENVCKHGGSCEQTDFGKFCKCPEGTAGDFCEDIPGCENLDCGMQSECKYNAKLKKATCLCDEDDLFFDPRDKKCKEMCENDKSCENQGKCTSVTKDLRFCDCLEGTTGDFCEIIPECSRLDCGADGYCVFNPSTKRADCACRDSSLYYDLTKGNCRRNCENNGQCLNGGSCTNIGVNKFCSCLAGTYGDRCEVVTDCASYRMRCRGDLSICTFDVKLKKAACSCRDSGKDYDSRTAVCKRLRSRNTFW